MGSDNTYGEHTFNPNRKDDLKDIKNSFKGFVDEFKDILSEIEPFLKKSETVLPISTAGKWKCTSDDKDSGLPMETLLSRVEEESVNYATAEHAAIDHLKMASAHLFEETEGRDVDNWLSDIEKIIQKLENRINS